LNCDIFKRLGSVRRTAIAKKPDACPCCKRPWPEEMEDTQDFVQATIVADGDDPRRSHKREKKVVSVILRAGGVTLEAVTVDVSDGGAKVFYLNGVLPVDRHVLIDCVDGALQGKMALTVWSRRQEKTYSYSGLKFC